MVDRESGHVLCDDCGEVLAHKAYRVDMADCLCLTCALERVRENMTNTAANVCASVDKYDADDFWEGM